MVMTGGGGGAFSFLDLSRLINYDIVFRLFSCPDLNPHAVLPRG